MNNIDASNYLEPADLNIWRSEFGVWVGLCPDFFKSKFCANFNQQAMKTLKKILKSVAVSKNSAIIAKETDKRNFHAEITPAIIFQQWTHADMEIEKCTWVWVHFQVKVNLKFRKKKSIQP